MKPKVFVTRAIPEAGLEILRRHAEVEVWPGEGPPPYEVLRARAAEADGLLTMVTDRVDRPLLEAAPKLKVVSNMAVGYDNIDVGAATERGVAVCHTPGVLTDTTADFAFGLLMAVARRIVEADKFVRAGRWKTWGPMAFLGHDVHGATLGIVGLGRIGLGVAERARGFRMNVLYYDPVRRPEEEARLGLEYVGRLEDLLPRCDFVSIHVPLTPETYHLIGEAQLRLMKPTAILVNTARGPIVDPKALYRALKEGWIAGAGLDVTEPEPIPPDDPLLTLDNVVITPHIASASYATRTRMAVLAAENLVAVLLGQAPKHCVNPEVLTGR